MEEKHLGVLVVGDPHFKVDKKIEDNDMAIEILRIAREQRAYYSFIVVLGDTCDRHQHINVYPLTEAMNFLFALMEIAPVTLLIGNHDRPNNSDFLSPYHPFVGLKRTPRITVVDTTCAEIVEGRRFVFVPYVPPGRFAEALAQIDEPLNAVAIFAHQEFRGAKMGAVVSKGDPWPKSHPLVISGHIHEYQRVRKNIVYVGSPAQHNFGDNERRTISLFLFARPCGWEEVRHDLALKKKVVFRVAVEDLPCWSPPSDVIVKVVVTGSAEKLREVAMDPRVKEWREKGVVVTSDEVVGPLPGRAEIREVDFARALLADVANEPDLVVCWRKLFA